MLALLVLLVLPFLLGLAQPGLVFGLLLRRQTDAVLGAIVPWLARLARLARLTGLSRLLGRCRLVGPMGVLGVFGMLRVHGGPFLRDSRVEWSWVNAIARF